MTDRRREAIEAVERILRADHATAPYAADAVVAKLQSLGWKPPADGPPKGRIRADEGVTAADDPEPMNLLGSAVVLGSCSCGATDYFVRCRECGAERIESRDGAPADEEG